MYVNYINFFTGFDLDAKIIQNLLENEFGKSLLELLKNKKERDIPIISFRAVSPAIM